MGPQRQGESGQELRSDWQQKMPREQRSSPWHTHPAWAGAQSRCLEAQLEPGGVREGNVSIDLSLGDWGGKTEVLQMMKWW